MATRDGRDVSGETRFGARERNAGEGDGIMYIRGAEGRPSYLILNDSAGDSHALWVDTTGDLRITQVDNNDLRTLITDPQSDGTVVGTQS